VARVDRVSTAGGLEPDLLAISQQVDAVVRVVDDKIEFGDPQDPSDPASAVRAGAVASATSHNGTLSNISGSWVEVSLEQTGQTTVTCYHNLYRDNPQYTVPVTGEPNCRWLVFGVMHDGDVGGAAPADTNTRIGVDVAFIGGDTVNANEIELRFNLRMEGLRTTVDATHPVLVTLFFTRASRGE
jgi:hypothetical protein